MPDVKPPPPYDYPSTSSVSNSAGSPAGCPSSFSLITNMEPCIADLPLSPDPMCFPQHRPSVPHCLGLHGPPFPVMARCNSSTLLTNLGLRYCSSSRQVPVGTGEGLVLGSFIHAGNTGNRPYKSMENLNWNHVADSGLCSINRSVDSEFILHCTTNSHCCGTAPGPHGSENLAFYPRPGLPKKDLPLFPQFLIPAGIDEWDARKGLREKLRLQSARSSAEPLKPLPLRPQVSPGEREGVHHVNTAGSGSRPPCTMRITNLEEIKQEVLRRLQLRRQNSSPNLALHNSPSRPRAVKLSYTTDNIAGNPSDSVTERCRAPVGRLHIPTFEEFKLMRQNENSTAGSVVLGKSEADSSQQTKCPSDQNMYSGKNCEEGEMSRGDTTDSSSAGRPHNTVNSGSTSSSSTSRPLSPICTGPSPRSPLQPLGSGTQEKPPDERGGDITGSRRRRSSLEPLGSLPFPSKRENWERPSSCCPALLLEGTDLSSYGAKIYKMKDGLIGSALDLIKKRSV